jgi:hypothetical protein
MAYLGDLTLAIIVAAQELRGAYESAFAVQTIIISILQRMWHHRRFVVVLALFQTPQRPPASGQCIAHQTYLLA